ncbi:hypothetical protein [Streptomyces sp. MS2.AVA.5]|uniref:Uncharacterized protein n=1 Tax=Streptomyces achmelvichensis TaxID=3134111 RepID=A0ACC6PN55_9ACTN
MPNTQKVQRRDKAEDAVASARHARFGSLPERVRPEDTTEVVPLPTWSPS